MAVWVAVALVTECKKYLGDESENEKENINTIVGDGCNFGGDCSVRKCKPG